MLFCLWGRTQADWYNIPGSSFRQYQQDEHGTHESCQVSNGSVKDILIVSRPEAPLTFGFVFQNILIGFFFFSFFYFPVTVDLSISHYFTIMRNFYWKLCRDWESSVGKCSMSPRLWPQHTALWSWLQWPDRKRAVELRKVARTL